MKKESGEIRQVNVAEEFERVTTIVSKMREAVFTIKDSDIEIKEWHFAVDKVGKEYMVDFKLKLAVKPRTKKA